MSKDWDAGRIPDQTGRVAIVTGANSGIGLETVRELARKGGEVVLACRSRDRAEYALGDLTADLPSAKVDFMELDLADLDQVRAFSKLVHERFQQLDLLINNAGVMMPPESKTAQGFELQLGVNHLGHFALTGLLLDLLQATPGSRVVNVSSAAHRGGRMDFSDLDFESRGYSPARAYGQSKLANLLFTSELARRFEVSGRNVLATAAHPGWTQTNLQQYAAPARLLNPLFGMQPPAGALPTLRAAVDEDAQPNDYYGPGGFMEMWGAPIKVGRTKAAQSRADAERLWQVSEERTGVRFEFA